MDRLIVDQRGTIIVVLAEIAAKPRLAVTRIRLWLACLAFFYPCYWASSFLVNAVPALVRVAAFGHKLRRFQTSLVGADVLTTAPPGSPRPRNRGRNAPFEVVPLVLGLAGVVVVAGGGRRAVSGFAAAMLGEAALVPWVMTALFRRRITPETAAGLVITFGILSLGLRWMAAAGDGRSYWTRAGTLFAAFVLPLAALPLLLFGRGVPGLYLAALVAPAAAAALLASFRPPPKELLHAGWGAIAVGVLASGLVVVGVRWQNEAADRARVTAHRAVMASLPAVPASLPYPKVFFQRGVNFTSEFPNIYGSEGAREMLERLPQHGIGAVALVPYGFTRQRMPQVGFPGGMEPDEGIEQLSAVAHAKGIKVLLKPQVWVSPGYPGSLEFSSEQDRRTWFGQYRLFLEHYARLAVKTHADVFCIGVEFEKLTRFDSDWRSLIGRTREIYPGPLVYAANPGSEFESITFWDALDYIGLNNYYPLPDDLSTTEVVRKVETVRQKYRKPVIFTEAGFSSFEAPHREPWSEAPRKLSLGDQARCYEAVFRAFYDKPWFQGMYWWKIGTSGSGGPQDGSHTPWGKPAMEVLSRWYLRESR